MKKDKDTGKILHTFGTNHVSTRQVKRNSGKTAHDMNFVENNPDFTITSGVVHSKRKIGPNRTYKIATVNPSSGKARITNSKFTSKKQIRETQSDLMPVRRTKEGKAMLVFKARKATRKERKLMRGK